MIYLLNAIGLSPGGSITVHIYTQTIHRTTQQQNTTQIITNGVIFYNTSQLSKNGTCMLQCRLNK